MEKKTLRKSNCRTRQLGTILRDNRVHDAYEKLLEELGRWATSVSRVEIYREVGRRTNVYWKTVQNTLNHTRKEDI